MTQSVCPLCDGSGRIEDNPPAALTLMQALVWRIVRDSGTRGVELQRLIAKVYADRADGGPLWAKRSLFGIIQNTNRKLRPIGMIIMPTGNGKGSVYRLIHTE